MNKAADDLDSAFQRLEQGLEMANALFGDNPQDGVLKAVQSVLDFLAPASWDDRGLCMPLWVLAVALEEVRSGSNPPLFKPIKKREGRPPRMLHQMMMAAAVAAADRFSKTMSKAEACRKVAQFLNDNGYAGEAYERAESSVISGELVQIWYHRLYTESPPESLGSQILKWYSRYPLPMNDGEAIEQGEAVLNGILQLVPPSKGSFT
jgi:hypothetical protein